MKQPALFPEPMIKNAGFSDCGKYRFWLSRTWDVRADKLLLIGLNPSTANAEKDDATIRKIIKIAQFNGYGGIFMTNLFPFITAYPSKLLTDDMYLAFNYGVLKDHGEWCADVCFCWGNFDVLGRDKIVKAMFPDALCLGRNLNGSPKHPLYLKDETKLIKFNS